MGPVEFLKEHLASPEPWLRNTDIDDGAVLRANNDIWMWIIFVTTDYPAEWQACYQLADPQKQDNGLASVAG